MTTNFSKANIQIRGELTINIHHPQEGFKLCWNEEKTIVLTGLNQSKSGVYCLRNKLNGRLYIGMTRNLENRKYRHFREINSSIHINNKLIEDWGEYVANVLSKNENACISPNELFEFEVIIYCRPSELTFYENLLIKYLNPYYNIHKQREIVCDPIPDIDEDWEEVHE